MNITTTVLITLRLFADILARSQLAVDDVVINVPDLVFVVFDAIFDVAKVGVFND